MTKPQSKICRAIAVYYGREAQTKQAVQEFAELIVEITKRPDQRADYPASLRAEIADCMIMLEQLCIMLDGNTDRVVDEIDRKLARQRSRIEAEIARKDSMDAKDRQVLKGFGNGE